MISGSNPFENVWETIAMYAYLFSALGLSYVAWGFMAWVSFYSIYGFCLVLGYIGWIYFDGSTCETGGRRSIWFRSCAWWKYLQSYFPINLHKTAELPPDRNYLLTVFPHGVLSVGSFSSFGTEHSNFKQLFPGLVSYLCTLRILFFLPVLRELMLMAGLISPSEKSINWVLGSQGVGRACVLVAGGATEASYNEPGVYKTIVSQRRGFCRIALQNGADLVPVFVFREIDVYELYRPSPKSLLAKFQQLFKEITGILPVWFVGQGVIKLAPKRIPIHVVVGKPIHVAKKDNPTDDEISRLHDEFKAGLINLFNTEKHKYLEDVSTELILV